MQPKLKQVEVKFVVIDDNNLSVEDAPRRQRRAQRIEQLREITLQRLLIATLNEDFIAVLEDEGTKSIPFRLENPASVRRQFIHALGEHWQNRRVNGKIHAPCYNRP